MTYWRQASVSGFWALQVLWSPWLLGWHWLRLPSPLGAQRGVTAPVQGGPPAPLCGGFCLHGQNAGMMWLSSFHTPGRFYLCLQWAVQRADPAFPAVAALALVFLEGGGRDGRALFYGTGQLCIIKVMVFPVVMYRCESWTIKKAEHRRIDAFELWCWRRLLRVPWTARRSNQSIL